MFCSLCTAEYRDDYSQCSDCNVALVNDLKKPNLHEFDCGKATSRGGWWESSRRSMRPESHAILRKS